MQNDLTACDGPLTATAAPIGRGGSRRRRVVRGLLALPLAAALIAPGAIALAAQPTSGYGQTTPAPTTPAPKSGTAPTQTTSTPAKETQPAKTSSEPTATTAKAKTLPFTGLDLRWITLGGLLLVGMGMSIVVVQRARRDTGR
jgi:hypothetical protein